MSTDRDAVTSTLLDGLHAAHHKPDSITMLELAEHLADVLAPLLAQARAEGARDALNAAADEFPEWWIADLLRERAAQHEEQP